MQRLRAATLGAQCALPLESCSRCVSSSITASFADPKAIEAGKAERTRIQKNLANVLPQKPKRPKRTPEELEDARQRALEYSRRCMHDHRAHQENQKLRKELRNNALLALPVPLRIAALRPPETNMSMKLFPPFATPPKYPKWRL